MRSRRRGFTLLELTIVIAVTAVMTAGIVTLCASVNGLSERTNATQQSLTDVSTIRNEASRWLSFFDKPTWTITVGVSDTPDDVEEADKKATCLVATSITDNGVQYYLRMTYAESKCTFVAEYPKSADGTNLDFVYEMSGTTLLHFTQISAENVEVPAFDSSGNTDLKQPVSAVLPEGAQVIMCSVSYFQTDSQGNLARKNVDFLIVARGRA